MSNEAALSIVLFLLVFLAVIWSKVPKSPYPSDYIGLNVEEFEVKAGENGVTYRVIERDGKYLHDETADVRDFNLTIENGIVIDVLRE